MTQAPSSRTTRSFTIPVIIAINVIVFLLWNFPGNNEDLSSFMNRHFLVSWYGLMQGRPWILITSVFSHNMFWHLFLNMFVLNSFGPFMERVIGTSRFLAFYFVAGIISSLSHAIVSAWILKQPEMMALGASGSISGLVILFSLMFPQQKLLILGLIPIPALWGALLFVGLDVWGLTAQADGGGLPIGHGAHLGGALTGALYYLFFIRPKMRRRQQPTHTDSLS
jgi:rhomboid-like protein